MDRSVEPVAMKSGTLSVTVSPTLAPASGELNVDAAYWPRVAPSVPKKPETLMPAKGTETEVDPS